MMDFLVNLQGNRMQLIVHRAENSSVGKAYL